MWLSQMEGNDQGGDDSQRNERMNIADDKEQFMYYFCRMLFPVRVHEMMYNMRMRECVRMFFLSSIYFRTCTC